MKSWFTFAGERSIEHGLTIEAYPRYIAAERIVEKFTIPGRSGALVRDTGAYSNASVSYEVWCRGDTVVTEFRGIAKWLLSPVGYQRLEDSYDPEVYRMALCANPIEFERTLRRYGRAVIDFDCKPQRFARSGEVATAMTNGGRLQNPGLTALPLLQIAGSGDGEVAIGDYVVTISDIPEDGLTIDCDLQDAWSGTLNMNSLLTLHSEFPKLEPGDSIIAWSGGVTGLTITPRWWYL